MILGQISWLDCIVFLIFLAPQLLIHVGVFPTLVCGLKALPFILIRLPLTFIHDHFFQEKSRRPPLQQASWFEDVVIRCVRYAFANIPAEIGRVFFSKGAAGPFLRWRMLRHGYMRKPIHWEEVRRKDFQGLWIIKDKTKSPDVVVFYAHGAVDFRCGGFSMGTSYFYLEYLLAFVSLLSSSAKFSNPAILALEYTLVPQAPFPKQLHQAVAGYKYSLSKTHDPSRVVFSGDSAGGTLILSLLLHIGGTKAIINGKKKNHMRGDSGRDSFEVANDIQGVLPGLAVLISPWTTLISSLDKNTRSDYLDATTLHHYARQYVGSYGSPKDPAISPGNCKDVLWWQRASPSKGYFVIWGKEEVFAPEIRDWVTLLEDSNIDVGFIEEEGGIHAWPVTSLFLRSTKGERIRGLQMMVNFVGEKMNGAQAAMIGIDGQEMAKV